MMRRFFLFLGLWCGVASAASADSMAVRWANEGRDAVLVAVEGQAEFFAQCIRSGFQARVRYELAVCRRRSAWFDRCGDTRTEVHGLTYDAVADQYTLSADTWGDVEPPASSHPGELAAAVAGVTTLSSGDLRSLGWAPDGRRYYLRVRAVADCKGEYNELFARIPYLLSFGLVRVNGYDSGTFDFTLDREESR